MNELTNCSFRFAPMVGVTKRVVRRADVEDDRRREREGALLAVQNITLLSYTYDTIGGNHCFGMGGKIMLQLMTQADLKITSAPLQVSH